MNLLKGALASVSQKIEHVAVGNSNSSASITVRLDKSTFLAGELVTGHIVMNVLQAHEVGAIVIYVKGEELINYMAVPFGSDFGKPPEKKTITNLFFEDTITIQSEQGIVQPGTSTFYFQYLLPEGLPGTFSASGGGRRAGDEYSCSIEYAFNAKVLELASEASVMNNFINCSLLSESKLILNAKAPTDVKYLRAEAQKNFKLSKGGLTIGTFVNQGGYVPGQQDILVLDVNNTSVNAISGIEIEIFEVVTYRNPISLLIRKLENHVKETKVHTVKVAGEIPPMFYGRKYIDFVVPATLAPSSVGYSHSRLAYRLNVKAVVAGAAGSLAVDLDLPVYAQQSFLQNSPLQIPNSKLELWRPTYQKDSEAATCPSCNVGFSVTKRRHHCRQCAQIFCSKCCSKTKAVPELGFLDSAPVCNPCFSTNPEPAPKTAPESALVYKPTETPFTPVTQPTFDPLVAPASA